MRQECEDKIFSVLIILADNLFLISIWDETDLCKSLWWCWMVYIVCLSIIQPAEDTKFSKSTISINFVIFELFIDKLGSVVKLAHSNRKYNYKTTNLHHPGCRFFSGESPLQTWDCQFLVSTLWFCWPAKTLLSIRLLSVGETRRLWGREALWKHPIWR